MSVRTGILISIFVLEKKKITYNAKLVLTENQHLTKNPQTVHWIFDHCSPETALPMDFIYKLPVFFE